jgi:integrase
LKTRARQRWIDMLWPVREVLMDLPQRTTTPSDLVFAGVHGAYLSHNWWYQKIWQPATKRAGQPGFHFHWLRHGYASLMAAWGLLGEFPLYVAQQMGHADANTTNRVYARLMREGVRLDQKDTLGRLYAAYKGELLPAADKRLPARRPVEIPEP